jgi:23S rRNA (pseudouridine1915-N3)-methyltransferase
MKIKLVLTGKTAKNYISSGMEEYRKRIQRYIGFEAIEIETGKQASNELMTVKKTEFKAQLKNIDAGDYIILLDEKGKSLNSIEFSGFIQQKMNESRKCLVFIIGGAYGFTDEMYSKADYIISLSPLTFSHQIVRLVFMEQLYRAMTIIKGEPYHHI